MTGKYKRPARRIRGWMRLVADVQPIQKLRPCVLVNKGFLPLRASSAEGSLALNKTYRMITRRDSTFPCMSAMGRWG